MTAILPLEEFVLNGFASKFQQTFSCPMVVTNEHEKRKTLERLFGGKPIEYPYAFAAIESTDSAQYGYNAHYFVRRGIETVISEDGKSVATVRCMPLNFEMALEFHTNAFMGQLGDTNSVMTFIRRWNMAARAGYLKYTVNYGRLSFGINVTPSPSTTIPQKENISETENVYIVQANCTIHGWVSEPIMGNKGIIQEVTEELAIQQHLDAVGPNAEFYKFSDYRNK
ncbi:hypothetical protein [Burkholderia phage BCSR5]|nr:hypothetical protein [Burkholderia phage BCSR5]